MPSSDSSPSISGSSVHLSSEESSDSGGRSVGPSSGIGCGLRVALTVYSSLDEIEVREIGLSERVDFEGNFEKVLCTPTILDAPTISRILKNHLCREFEFVVPLPQDRACYPPQGFFTLYEDTLVAGLRFPLHSAFTDLINRVRIPIGQIAPNCFRQFVCLGVEAYEAGVDFSADLILKFFHFKVCPTGYYLSPRIGEGLRLKTPSKIPRWQEKYFFCRIKDVPLYDWRRGSLDDVEFDSSVSGGALECRGRIDRKYSEADLAGAGLSPFVVGEDTDPGEDLFFLSFSFLSYAPSSSDSLSFLFSDGSEIQGESTAPGGS